jgi:heptosyltransferase-2
MNRVLCMCLSGLGDAILFSPTISELKKAHPCLAIDVLVMFRAVESIYAADPAVSQVHYVDFLNQSAPRSLLAIWAIRRQGYDAVIAAYPSNRAEYSLVQIMLGGRRIGHRYIHLDRVNLNFLRQDTVREDQRHVVEQNLALLSFLGVPPSPVPVPMQLHLASSDLEAARRWIDSTVVPGRPLFGFHAGSALLKNHIHKRWAADRFGSLARRLVEQYDAHVAVFGGPEEDELKRSICASSGRFDRVHSVEKFPFMRSAALLKMCRMMVSNDSGLMHVAAAVGTPTVAILAYTNVNWVHPWCVPYRVVRKELSCSPCFYHSPRPARCWANLNYACIDISVDTVFEAASDLMRELNAQANPVFFNTDS